ncbi:MAG: c-type cytochrome [Anaerolineales bacterium]|jgi:mono/diheme cytochrome c family protein
MNEQEKQDYLEEYQEAKKHGEYFFPDAIFKDAIITLIVFLVLVGLAYFVGAPLEARANPADTSYTPRPEWYFLFLFQLLKYFPGNLEVVGVVLIPTIVIILLFLLPLLDRSRKRYFLSRPIVIGVTAFAVVGIVYLTTQAVLATPPPAEVSGGDPTAALYAQNCAGCHGPNINIEPGTNLHEIIASGKHEGMPAWSGDLTSDQIDSLVGFILSPAGSQLFTRYCGECHETTDLVSGNPIDIRNALNQGLNFAPHADVNIPDWSTVLTEAERTSILNFLIAPDGQRIFTVDCAPCHGTSVAFSGSEEELREIISQGGLHLTMPPWRQTLNDEQIDILAQYVVDPANVPQGNSLFADHCAECHGERVPQAQDVATARTIIAQGGQHQTMPVWGNILTSEQLDALVSYTLDAARGTSLEVGQNLFATNCSPCHGELGEGGVNPTRPNDIIAPISSAEYLKTRDNATLRAVIAQGQPNFGMSPFSSSFGGPLDDDQIDAIVAYIRSWEANPPVELPPEVSAEAISGDAKQIFGELCAQCHAEDGSGGVGPSLIDAKFKNTYTTDQQIFDTINLGHPATPMIAWGEILSSEQIQKLVAYIRQLGEDAGQTSEPTETSPQELSFETDIKPIFEEKCKTCHGVLGGWDSSTYDSVMTTGNNAPVVIPGDPENSLLAQKLLGTQETGGIMPPGQQLPDDEIQLIVDWIAAGANE